MKPTSEGSIKITENEADKTALSACMLTETDGLNKSTM